MENYKSLLSTSHFVGYEVVSGSQLALLSSGSVSQMNGTVKVGPIPMGGFLSVGPMENYKKRML